MKLKTIVFLFLVACILFLPSTSAELWNESWSAYSTVTMNITAPDDDFQVHFTSDDYTIPLAMWNEMDQNGNDTRIINYNHTLEFPIWIEHITARDNYSIWVNVTDNTSATYQWYYGNPSVNSVSDGDSTFKFFDDFYFEESVLSVTKTLVTTTGIGQQEHNTMNYIDTALWSYNGSQYIVYVNDDGHVYVGKRLLPEGAWSVYDSGGTVSSITDPHCTASIGIDADGYLHISYGMHAEALRYRNSTNPEDPTSWSTGSMIGSNETSVTYPRFFMANNILFFSYREGDWTDGDQYLDIYNTSTKTWSKLQHSWIDGGGKAVYLDNVVTDSNGVLHITFQWRIQSDSIISAGNYTYAYSDDNGTTWKMENGTAYNLPITRSNAQCFLCDEDASRINQQGLDVDSNGYPHLAFWKNGTWTDGDGKHHLNYWHAHYNGTGWTIQQRTNYTDTPTSGVYTYCEKDFARSNCLINRTNDRVYTFGRIIEDGYIRVWWSDPPYNTWTEKKLGNETWGWQEFSTVDRTEWHTNHTFYMMASDADDVDPANVYVLKSDLTSTEIMSVTGTINSSKWTGSGGSIGNGYLELSNTEWFVTVPSFTDPYVIETDLHIVNNTGNLCAVIINGQDTDNKYMHQLSGDASYTKNDFRFHTKVGGSYSLESNLSTGLTIDPDIWYHLVAKIVSYDAHKFQITSPSTGTEQTYNDANDRWSNGKVGFRSSSFETTYADTFLIREYTDTEPDISNISEPYWIETTGVSISLVSFTPSPLHTNYTGATVISYLVEHANPLNLSSLAFLYGLNYTITGDMHNYIATPPIDIASEGIYLAPNRNITPYLSWEFNTTITNNSVWQWGGGDNDSWWISKNPVNATHTYINATGVTQHVLPSSFYIQKLAMYNAPKTGFEINRLQGIIIKMWNVEEIRNRNANYFANLYFDTSWESTLPTYPVEVGFCNFSYDPNVDDIDTSSYCTKFGEWDGNRWVNHSWVPGSNASYAYPFVVNASQFTEPTPTDIDYIWLRSNTISSKSYVLNATDYDPGITNISFAETDTMWTYNELNGVTTPVAYTPSFFTTFVRDYEELLHHLYIADDTGTWGHSEIFNETIGLSSVPVLPVSFEHFNITCQGDYIEDTLMDATYDEGSILVNIHCPADPDGGTVSHNLTLHYATNQTLIAVINDTFTTTGDEYVDINFTTTPYYSSSDFYTLRCVSTDDENDVATKWLISYFTLDADGNQGWVVDDRLLFWGMDDIPTLYATVANDSLISYNVGTNNYTTHVPFFKSKSNDTFRFNETVHLESLNDENVSYFRHSGETIFDNATIHAWNTTTDTPAPITDEYRGYVYSHFDVCGNITNSDFSHIGSEFYRQEGLNFIDNTHKYLIFNTTFSHNTEGPIMEYCSNMNISQCTITDNVNAGVGIYFTNDTTVSNNVIDSNGGRSITMYEANNNIISYNDITNSGIHGVHYWSNSQNNTCTGNDISGSALYDYYLSSSSTENYIIDPASTTDRIRVTSTSSVNIENTDNTVFTEDSLNTSYAYLTNFSMFVSSASQTFDITQRDMTILPSTDKVAIWNFEWGPTIVFDITSETEINPTWFNITHDAWSNKDIYIYRNDDDYATELATESGKITFNYSENLINIRFRFTTETPAWDALTNSIAWAISIAQFLVTNIGVVIVTAFSLTCILIIMILIGMALSVTNIIYR